MKKQIMSIAAIAALFTTGAMAFDTDQNGRLLKQEGTKYIKGNYHFDVTNVTAEANLTSAAPGQLGDALIYPAFYSDKGWESEFTVINTGDEAMVAKVVFYSAENSKELKDFNIYLSAHDVFRATVKENKLIIKDSSFVSQAKTPEEKTNFGYTYTDTAKQASESAPVTTDLPEGTGYIAVYGMIQADDSTTVDVTIHGEDITAYHQNHDKLWRDYRHLVDECRGEAWRGGIQEGIYNQVTLNTPNINLNTDKCGVIRTTQRSTSTIMQFKSPDAKLAGSITLKGNDSRGTRAMTLNAVPLTNFTDDSVKQGMLWTEGEFASIADRDIIAGIPLSGNYARYDATKVLNDSKAFDSTDSYKYEYGSATANKFVLTQPHKRTLVQLIQDLGPTVCRSTTTGITASLLNWEDMVRVNASGKKCLITNYGAFKVSRKLYDDNEKEQTAEAGGFTFSPATVTTEVNKAPGEVTSIENIVSEDDRADGFTSGYATISIPVPGIATQMTGTQVDGNCETNWIYSGKLQ